MKLPGLERNLGVRFKDRRLLEQALVHPSYLNEVPPDQRPAGSYQRLEFLGDAVLGAAITLELYHKFPELEEGQLTKFRSTLVSGKTLARVATGLELGRHLKLGKGEEATGGRARESNLAAAFESLVGAIFLDRGFDKATRSVLMLMGVELGSLVDGGVLEDPKSRLQELAQRMVGEPPRYKLVESAGPDHAKSFTVEVLMDGRVMGSGTGNRKLDAEMEAAVQAIHKLDSPAG